MPDHEPGPALAEAARWILLAVSLAGAALLLYAVDRFRSLTGTRALTWYAIAVVTIAFGVVASRLRPARRVALVLLCATGGLSLAGLEGAAVFAERSALDRQRRAVEALTGAPFDTRTVADVVHDLRAAGTPAVPSVVPNVVIPYTLPESDPRSRFHGTMFPLAGVSRRLTVDLCNEAGHYPVYESDQYGYLNPASAWDSVPASLVLIGDSFVHGYCVPADSSLPNLLRRRWSRTLSLGSGGSGPLSELGALTEYALPAQPSLVLWVYFENDLENLSLERRHPILARYLDPAFSQHLRERQGEIDSQLVPWVDHLYGDEFAPQAPGVYGLRQLLTLSALRTAVNSMRRGSATNGYLEQVALFRQVLAAARDRVTPGGGRLALVYLPRWERYFAPTSTAVHEQARVAVLATARELGVPAIDLTPEFDGAPDRALLFGHRAFSNAHYSSTGYALVAGVIEAALDSLGLAPPSSRNPR